jgi:hypothetical protein
VLDGSPNLRQNVSKHENTKNRILSGAGCANISFDDLRGVLLDLGFRCARVKGSHHIYVKDGVPDIINAQPGSHGKAKPYRVRQVRRIILTYKL